MSVQSYAGTSKVYDRPFHVEDLDPNLVKIFDSLTDAAFDINTVQQDVSYDEEESAINLALLGLGVKILGSEDLFHEVLCVLADGPAQGGLLAALGELHHSHGLVDLGWPAFLQVWPEGAQFAPLWARQQRDARGY